jgi:hypothetical protein
MPATSCFDLLGNSAQSNRSPSGTHHSVLARLLTLLTVFVAAQTAQ